MLFEKKIENNNALTKESVMYLMNYINKFSMIINDFINILKILHQ